MMAETGEAAATTTTSTTVTVNVGYPRSWQGALKIFKILCLLACLICAAIIVSGLRYHNNLYYRYGYLNNELNYCLAMAVIGLVSELVFFILYLVGATRSCTGQAFAIIVTAYHVIMTILMYAACIIMTGYGSASGRAYNAFGILALAGFALEVYFNVIWMKGGPELVAFLG